MENTYLRKTLVYVTTLALIGTTLTMVPKNVVAKVSEEKLPEEGWFIEGNDTYFELTNSSYLNITLTSSENVHVYLEAFPKVVWFYIESNCSVTSTLITLSGFETGKIYYLYQDGNLMETFTTDEYGSYCYTQDLTTGHRVSIHEEISTIYILSDGAIDPPTAPISKVGDTYTLTDNIYDEIVIQKSGIILDGAGYTVQGPGDIGAGIFMGYGYMIPGVENVTIKNLNIAGFYYGINAYTSSDVTITDNTISNNRIGIRLFECDSSVIIGNAISYNRYGIYLQHSSLITITGNTISNNYYGIFHWLGGWSVTITGNTISNNYWYGTYIYGYYPTCTITNNTISNSYCGIYLYRNCDYATITGNTVSNNQVGIYLYWYCNYATITGNTVSNNHWGIALWYYCDYATITGNTVSNSYWGIDLGYSIGNTFYHNNIISNTYQFYGEYTSNTWDNGAGEGNYWSDYTGLDDGSNGRIAGDGIGDTLIPHPYTDQGDGYYQLDNYPLTKPWTPNDPPVAHADGPYEADEGETITFNASGSTDPDNDPLEYRWDFDNDSIWDTIYSTDPTATYTWYDDFSGIAKVEVYDGEYTDTATATVTVFNVAPTVDAGVDKVVEVFNIVSFSGSFVDPGFLDTHTIEWDFGDGSTTSGTLTPTHTYDLVGIYTVTLTVTDDDGGVEIDTLIVEVIQKYCIWAHSTIGGKTIEWSGSKTIINDHIHSNNDILISGSDNTVNGIVYYASRLEIGGDNISYNSAEQISPRSYPIFYDITDYQPRGIEAVNAQNEGKYHYINGDLEVSDSNVELDGLYYVTGNVKLSGSEIIGIFTIVAEGNMEISGSKHNYGSYCNDLLFFSQGDLFKLSGSENTFEGITYVPVGEIEISGSKNTVTGSFFGDTMGDTLSGSELTITAL